MTDLANRLNELMAKQDKNIVDLQKAIGVTYEMARRYTLGTAIPRDDKLCKIAEYLGVPPSYLKYGVVDLTEEIPENRSMEYKNSVVIDVLDIEASAGDGVVNGGMVQMVKQLQFVPEEFHKYYPGITPANIRIINVKGDSMYPTFNNGDLLFVDISIQSFDGDGIYIFSFDNTLFVKRIQKTGRNYCIISDNEALYKPWFITPNDMPEMRIHGKVKIHQSQKLNFVG